MLQSQHMLTTRGALWGMQLLRHSSAAAADCLVSAVRQQAIAECGLLQCGHLWQHTQLAATRDEPPQQRWQQTAQQHCSQEHVEAHASLGQASVQCTAVHWKKGTSLSVLQQPIGTLGSSRHSSSPWQRMGRRFSIYHTYSTSTSASAGSICSRGSTSSPPYTLDPIHSISPAALLASRHQPPEPNGRVAAIALSGGVDSAVSALLLKLQGFEVFGVYMHNWDTADEAGAGKPTCTSSADLQDAKAVAAALQIPLYEADFVSKYWNSVFQQFLAGLEQGLTPNPDLACNSYIKFGALLDFATAKGADVLATGHYARLAWTQPSGGHQQLSSHNNSAVSSADTAAGTAVLQQRVPVLLTGSDSFKDQTYFLAGLHQRQLARAMFPVGHLTKAQVKRLAQLAGLPKVLGTKRSSAGICFIGKRSFGHFLEDYIPRKSGVYVDVDSGRTLGECHNILAVTGGQRALGLGGQQTRVYVVGKDLASAIVHVAFGHDHPALYSSQVLLLNPSWVAGRAPGSLQPAVATGLAAACRVGTSIESGQHQEGVPVWVKGSNALRCDYKARYRQPSQSCSVKPLEKPFTSSKFCKGSALSSLQTEVAAGATGHSVVQQQQLLTAGLFVPERGLTPGQMFVMYDGDVCLGSAMIAAHGPTELETGLCNSFMSST